jgi:MtN3 and saliva related transmembrane protein
MYIFSFLDRTFLIGFVGGICTTISFFPQVIKVVRSGSVQGLSFPMFAIHFLGDILWVVYGIFIHDVIIISFETVASIFNLIILSYFIRNRLCRQCATLR